MIKSEKFKSHSITEQELEKLRTYFIQNPLECSKFGTDTSEK